MYVMDASVAVKWLMPEGRRAAALAVMTGAGALVAPDLIVTEVCAALSRKARLRQLSPAAAEEALSAWLDAIPCGLLALSRSVDLVEEFFQLPLAMDHALTDCCCAALTRRAGGVPVTADEKLARKATAIPGIPVRLLGQA